MKDIFLSICVMTYNRFKTLSETIDSLEANNLPNDVEIVISDNASTDATETIVSMLKKKHSSLSIRYYKNDINYGFDGNFARSIERSAGKYTWMFSDDDIMPEGVFNYVYEILKKNDYNLLYLAHYSFRENTDYRKIYKQFWPKQNHLFNDGMKFFNMAGLGFISTLVYNTELAKKEISKISFKYDNAHVELGIRICKFYNGNYLFIGEKSIAARMPVKWGRGRFMQWAYIDTGRLYQDAADQGLISQRYVRKVKSSWALKSIPLFIINSSKDGFLSELIPLKKRLIENYNRPSYRIIINLSFLLASSSFFICLYKPVYSIILKKRIG